MSRYFAEFIDLTNSKRDDENFIVTIKLFNNTLPKTTNNISKLFYNPNVKEPTYRKSKVTRVIAPEYLVQFGDIVRRHVNDNNLKIIDNEECETELPKFNKKIIGRHGIVIAADKLDDNNEITTQLCILFVPWGEYDELNGYIPIGECKEWKKLSEWMGKIKVDSINYEIPQDKGVWIRRCGRLRSK